jgi:hypothetical protein
MITNEDVDNIIDAAFSWMSYWCDDVKIENCPENIIAQSEALTRGGKVFVHEFEEDEWYELKIPAIKKAIRTVAKQYNMSVEDFIEDHDGPSADAVIQQSIFDEIVYG